MADEDFIIETDGEPFAAHEELTGWETVIFELADEEEDGETK
jgi:hypothetical protein